MIDIGMSELLVVGTIALIVIGPKDLPELFRSLGRMTAKLRAMSREFSRAMEAAANESGVKDVAADLRKVTSAKSMGLDAVKDATTKFENWDPLKTAKSSLKPAAAATKPAEPVKTAETPAPAPKVVEAKVAEAVPPPPKPAAAKPAAKGAKVAKVAKPAVKAEATAPAAVAKKPRAPRKPKPKADA